LQVAPSPVFTDPADGSPVPLGIILPMCDADVINQEGQHFYEGARLAPDQQTWITSVFVERANHNFFNTTLGDDPFGRQGRPDCATLLEPKVQQTFLGDYAIDFLTTLFKKGPAVKEAQTRLGMDPGVPAPSELYGLPARIAALPSAAERVPIFTPATASELTTNRLGGAVQAEGVKTFFCEAGHYTPTTHPGSEPCRRTNVSIPGDPALVVVSWEKPGATLRFQIPQGKGDLSHAATLSLRASVDPLSTLNVKDKQQAFSIRVTDGAGKTATVSTRANEPALRFPVGEVEKDQMFGDMFTGRLPLTTVRILMSELQGVDQTDIREIALVFDQTPTGSLFLSDVEWVHSAALQGQGTQP